MIKARVLINTTTFEVLECEDYSEFSTAKFDTWRNGELQGREYDDRIYIYVDERDLE